MSSSFETRASPGRRIYYRYRGGRSLRPVSQGRAGLVALQTPTLTPDEAETNTWVFLVIPGGLSVS